MSIKFTELPALSTLTVEDVIALVHDNTSYKATLKSLMNLLLGELSSEHPSINAVEVAGDYIVAREETNGWKVNYYKSGRCEAWKTVNQVVSDAADRGSFRVKVGDTVAVPARFVTVDYCWVQAGTAAGTTGPFFLASLISKGTGGVRAAFIAPDYYQTVSISTINVSYLIKGTYNPSIFN